MKIFIFGEFLDAIVKLIPYIPYTLAVVISAMLLSVVLGVLLAYMKMRKSRIARGFAYLVTTLIRGTPFLVLLFVVFYGLPVFMELFGINITATPKLIFMLLTLTLFNGSRLSEVFRSAYESIENEQREAAVSVGLTSFQSFRRIILPQTFYIALPNIGNSLLGTLMETSLGYTIGLVDIMGKAKLVNSYSYGTFTLEIYLAVAIVYWVISMVTDRLFGFWEERVGRPYQMGAVTRVQGQSK